jgi:hypothetical protein
VGRDLEISGYGLFQGIIQVSGWEERDKSQKMSG